MTIEKLEELLNAATPGPWTYYEDVGAYGIAPSILEQTSYYPSAPGAEDTKLIVAMRNLMPELLAVVKAAESAADKCDLRILFGPLRVLETKLKGL